MSVATLFYEHTPAAATILVAVGLAGLAALYTAWRYLGLTAASAVALGVRAVFLALLGWCLFMPYEKQVTRERIKPKFLIALDTSASMAIRARDTLPSRLDRAREVLGQSWVDLVRARYDVEAVSFDREVGPRVEPKELLTREAAGGASHLRDALRKLSSRMKGQEVAGIVLLSDGQDTRETSADWTRETWPAPVFTVRLEPPDVWGVEADVRVESISTPKRVTVGWASKLEASVAGQAAKGTAITVQLLRNGALEKELPVQLPEEGGTRQVSFELEHNQVGRFSYAVKIPGLPGERNLNDNEMSTEVLVTDARNRVVYVEHVPRWESKYLNRVLSAVPNITAIGFLKGPGGRFITYGNRGNTDLVLTKDQMDFIKVILLGDLTAEALGEERAKAIERYVDSGGSLLLLGGPEGWGASGFGASALKPLLPVAAGALTPREGTYQVGVTDEGKNHPAFAVGQGQEFSTPPVLSVFTGAKPDAGSSVLVTATLDGAAHPLVVTRRYGQGRVVAILTDSLWRWKLQPDASKPYDRFWTQMMGWLMPKQEAVAAYDITLASDVEQTYLGETVNLNARLGGTQGRNRTGASLTVEIETPDGRKIPYPMAAQPITTGAGETLPGFALPFEAKLPGLHRAVARTEIDGVKVESDSFAFFVKPFTPETKPGPIAADVLASLSTSTGGKFCEPDQLAAAVQAIQVETKEIENVRVRTLWNRQAVILALIGLLTVEWIWRKVKGWA